MAPVILWDIDGTLVRSNGGRVSLNAFLRAVRLAAELDSDLPYPPDLGRQDRPADRVRGAGGARYRRGSRDRDRGALWRGLSAASSSNTRELLTTDLRVLPGVSEVLGSPARAGHHPDAADGQPGADRAAQTDLCRSRPLCRLRSGCIRLGPSRSHLPGADHPAAPARAPRRRGARGRHRGHWRHAAGHRLRPGGRRAGGRPWRPDSSRAAMLAEHQPDLLLDDLADTDAVVAGGARPGVCDTVSHAPSSSRGLGRSPFKAEIAGSNPAGGTARTADPFGWRCTRPVESRSERGSDADNRRPAEASRTHVQSGLAIRTRPARPSRPSGRGSVRIASSRR